MSLRFIPDSGDATSVSTGHSSGASNNLTTGSVPAPFASSINGKHPLQNRLEKWNEVQMDFKMETLKRTYGLGEPIRRSMEMEMVKNSGLVPEMMGSRNDIHLEILQNRDASIEWEDIYTGKESGLDFHAELERAMRM